MGRRIITTCSPFFPGVRAVFRHGEELGLWKFMETSELLVWQYPQDALVIFGAWDQYNYAIQHVKNAGSKVALLWTSSIGQMEMAQGEVGFFEEIRKRHKEGKIDFLLAGDETICNVWKEFLYFAYPISSQGILPINLTSKESPRAAGLFLPSHPRKNVFNQKIAAELAGVKLYHNTVSAEDFICGEYQNLPDHQEFIQRLSQLWLTLNVKIGRAHV